WAIRRVISTIGPSTGSCGCSRATGAWTRSARRFRGRCCLSGSSGSTSAGADGAGRARGRAFGEHRDLSAADPDARGRSYVRGARILSIGIASTGLLTLAYFSISSHVLDAASASRIALLWSVMFVIISVIYRPVEQLLSRTIAERRARGQAEHPLRVPLAI